MKIFKQGNGKMASRRRRAGVAIAVSIASVVVSLVGAVPAQAAAAKGFTIYYSPNCAGASRYYPGVNSGEQWINDTFNLSPFAAGYGQHIRSNAASIVVPYGTTVNISFSVLYNGVWTGTNASFTGGGFCVNFGDLQRNGNLSWSTY
ncbi:hypothetical protein [Leifsonia sp. NPDC058248]|uniref:hypothetical protein n=1 Tax=Leifsonia sp. NPDC058248 TaxID=3346402 RepID=UPI0036DE238D